jgi:predicted N-acetyltransferase YhbS
MRIDRIEELRLAAEDEAAIAHLLAEAFGTEFGGRSYFMQRHHLRLVARDPGIVGHVGLTFRAVRFPDRLVPVLGVADVATAAERRGQGIAGRLIEAVIDEGKAGPAEFIALFGTAGLYEAAGFLPVSNPLRAVDMNGARTRGIIERQSANLLVMPLRGRAWDCDVPIDFLGHFF